MFLLFTFNAYYPGGGSSDFAGAFETFDAAAAPDAIAAYEMGEFREIYDVRAGKWFRENAGEWFEAEI